jgi:hypothetical protein
VDLLPPEEQEKETAEAELDVSANLLEIIM